MKALTFPTFGAPEVLELLELPDPVPAAEEMPRSTRPGCSTKAEGPGRRELPAR